MSDLISKILRDSIMIFLIGFLVISVSEIVERRSREKEKIELLKTQVELERENIRLLSIHIGDGL